ncbi:MAG TPA: fasciclin domain-containing protein [Aquaticitalea sp.]|nr:fasciclin domain-containing protein [Aquaticitalea sp.]
MKLNRLSIVLGVIILCSFTLVSCKDDKKESEQIRLETERVEMENAKKAEDEKMAMKAKEDELKREEARSNSIAGKAMKNSDLTTLVSALESTDLSTMLSEPGDYTIFAPSNQAFNKLSEKEREELMMPENKERLKNVLQYHMLPGKISSDRLASVIKSNNNSYKVNTVTGEEVTLMMSGDQYIIKDGSGKKAQVILGNQEASNGIIYIIDTVLMAKR